jgi:pimeloyl-ACP methyl ester carboxylesterase
VLGLGRTVLTTTQRIVETNGVQLQVLEAGDRGAPVVLLCHGFPDLARTWHHQLEALANAGFHVLAPDQRGYGRSTRPDAVEAYNTAELVADLLGLLDDVGAQQAAWIGHDLGARLVWSAAHLHPDRVAAVAGLSVPPMPQSPVPPTQAYRKMVGDGFLYILYFQEPGPADVELNADPGRSLRGMIAGLQAISDPEAAMRMYAPGPTGLLDRLPEVELPEWLSGEEFDAYVGEFTRTGFTGALNWYRNLDRNWQILATPKALKVTAPALYIAGTADPVLALTRSDRATQVVSGTYREVMVEGAGHWLHQERPSEVTAELLRFLFTDAEWGLKRSAVARE